MSGVSGLSWAQFPETFVDQFVQLFALPGEDDPNSLDTLSLPLGALAGEGWPALVSFCLSHTVLKEGLCPSPDVTKHSRYL